MRFGKRLLFLIFSAFFVLLTGCESVPQMGAGSSDPMLNRVAATRTLYGNYLAGRFAGAMRDTNSAAVFYQRALQRDPDNTPILERAFFLALADGQVDEARYLAYDMVERDPGHRTGRLVLAIGSFIDEDYEATRQHLKEGRKGPISMVMSDLVTAWSYVGEGDPDKAIITLDMGVKSSNLKIFYLTARAYINDYTNQYDAAANDYLNILQQTQWSSRRLVQAYGRLLERKGDVDDARKMYNEYLELAGQDTLIEGELLRMDSGKAPPVVYESAREGLANAVFGPATYLMQERSIDLPIIYLQLATHLHSDFPEARMLLGELFERNNGWEDAIRAYKGVSRSSEYYRDAQLQIAINYERLDRSDEGVRLLTKLLGKDPTDIGVTKTLGDLHRVSEDYALAVEAYTKALEIVGKPEDQHWGLFYARGVAYERLGDWDKAEVDFLKSIDLSPDQPLTLNYLGYSWIDKGMKYEEATKLIRRAVELKPDDGFIIDSLGWAFYRQGQYHKAVEYLERAVQLQSGDPTINEHLGDAYWKVGRLIEARFQWRQSLDLKPEDDQIPLLEKKLKVGLDDVSNGAT